METKSQNLSFTAIINSGKPVLVDFYAVWCGPCKMMAPALEEVKNKYGDKIYVIKIDVDKNQKAASDFQIQGVPTLILFQKGKVLWRQSGALSSSQIENVLNRYLVNEHG